jgi:hypothetical protein
MWRLPLIVDRLARQRALKSIFPAATMAVELGRTQ